MSNRRTRRKTTKKGSNVNVGEAIAEGLRQAAAKRQAEQQAAQPTEDTGVGGMLPRPNEQTITAKTIEWVWIVGNIAHVESTYSKVDGSYEIRPFSQQTEPYTGEQAKAFGEALLSAYQWQHIWVQHAGEFLMATSQPEPEASVTPIKKAPAKRAPRKAPAKKAAPKKASE